MVVGLIKSVKVYLHGYLISKAEQNMHKVPKDVFKDGFITNVSMFMNYMPY